MPNSKICTACGKRKKHCEFGLRGKVPNRRCKQCLRDYMWGRARTPEGKAANAWRNITHRAGNRNGKNPTYSLVELRMTRAEFMAWSIPAYAKWVSDGNSIESGSVDRVEDTGHYEIGNLQIITLVENTRKQKRNKNVHAPAGEAWCPGCKKHKPKSEFYVDPKSWTGVSCRCKKHHNAYQREYYRKRRQEAFKRGEVYSP